MSIAGRFVIAKRSGRDHQAAVIGVPARAFVILDSPVEQLTNRGGR
jgi:hypothetical protein